MVEGRWGGGTGCPQMGEGVVGWAMTDFPRQGAGMFPTAPTAHNEKAQASGLGIGHNNGTGGLKARYIRRTPDLHDDYGPSALESFQCPVSWGCTPGWDGAHLWCWGRVQPPGLSKGRRSGWFEGQRPGLIPAYGIAIGFGHRNGWRAEGPVSFPVSLARTDGSGLQPSNRFNVPIPGAVPQAGMGRTFGAGVGRGSTGDV